MEYNISFSYYKADYLFWQTQFNINKGDKILLLGFLGSGKTTLLEILCGLNKAWQGSIDGVSNKEYVLPKISYLPEKPVLLNNQTIEDNIKYLLKVLRLNYKNFDYSGFIKKYNLESFSKTKVKYLPEYARHKIAFLRTEIKNPEFIFIDDLLFNNYDNQTEVAKLIENVLNKDCGAVVASNGKVYEGWNFNKIYFIRNRQIEVYNSLKEFENKNPEFNLLIEKPQNQ